MNTPHGIEGPNSVGGHDISFTVLFSRLKKTERAAKVSFVLLSYLTGTLYACSGC